jgi:small subunit ribosomal protein S18
MCREGVEWVDYKDVPVLRKYMSDRGKIRSRRVTGNCAQHQRDIAQAIKVARELVLLPYTQRTVTEKPGGRGGRGDRGDRGDRPMGSGGYRGNRGPAAADRAGPVAGAAAAKDMAPSATDGEITAEEAVSAPGADGSGAGSPDAGGSAPGDGDV